MFSHNEIVMTLFLVLMVMITQMFELKALEVHDSQNVPTSFVLLALNREQNECTGDSLTTLLFFEKIVFLKMNSRDTFSSKMHLFWYKIDIFEDIR